ncbi:ORFL248W.iORF2 [Human betaherpesvirus 5]|nr:ORFL248W.iORF2 [Human betaherpesvirus 5]QHX40622.1 ORFL248W.iORF2 [Human betaherpesvirus 5]
MQRHGLVVEAVSGDRVSRRRPRLSRTQDGIA